MRGILLLMFLLLGSLQVVNVSDVWASEGKISERKISPLPPQPSCQDEKLKELVWKKINSYYAQKQNNSLIEKRRKKLLEKSLTELTEISVANFSRKENENVAAKILMVKINNALKNEDLRLCRSVSSGRIAPVYVLIYPENYYQMVEVFNYGQPNVPIKDSFFIFE